MKTTDSESFILELFNLVPLSKLISRLNELNDGSFEIEDRETERIKKL